METRTSKAASRGEFESFKTSSLFENGIRHLRD
jgi:hypothetical protein